MSGTEIKRPYEVMRKLADGMVDRVAPHCKRIEVAGSVRRQRDLCGDLELVCIADGHKLDAYLGSLLDQGKIRHVTPRRWGPKTKIFVFNTSDGRPLQVDIYAQSPATWGVNFMIRTGSSVFSHRMVTPRSGRTKQGLSGFMPDNFEIKDARVWVCGIPLDTPEEEDIFRLWGMDVVPPTQRTDQYQPILRDPPTINLQPATLFNL